MSLAWKKAKCKDCIFCMGEYCRRLPPTIKVRYMLTDRYPRVRIEDDAQFENFACAEYRPDTDKRIEDKLESRLL